MESNVFAVILPGYNSNAAMAFEGEANRRFFVHSTEDVLERNSRESTPCQPGSEDDDDDEALESRDRLMLHFDSDLQLKDPTEGWLFGYSAQQSDIVICLPKTIGVSRRHFAISLGQDFRVYFHQLTSQETCVMYHSRTSLPHQIRPQQGDKFLVCLAPSDPIYWNSIEVIVADRFQSVLFEIQFPNHTANATHEYYEHMRQWLQNTAPALPPVDGPSLQRRASTTSPSRQSPMLSQFGTLCYQRTIGVGAFGVVEMLVDLKTGDVAARKRLSKFDEEDTPSIKNRALKDFLNEARLMQRNPHPNIIQLLALREEPVPSILMPYYPHGNIARMSLRPDQYHRAFRQLLIVLDYLHGRNVAHRDLKPENILVERLDPIHIVVSDFGLSREAIPGSLMTTFCGTRLYSAPDIFPYHDRGQSVQGYWVSVDIWSAGMIMFEWMYGLPDTVGMGSLSPDEYIVSWSQVILSAVREKDVKLPIDPVIDILKHMLVIDPQDRYQARDCLQQGWQNGLFKRTRSDGVIDIKDSDADDFVDKLSKPEGQTTPGC